jgi:hypothetical protein
VSEPNLRVLKRSRTKPVEGDVFTLSPADGLFLFGRVIRADMPRERAPMPGSYLLYIYRHTSAEPAPSRRDLHPQALLLAPVFTNRMPWTKGYFEVLTNWPLSKSDLVPQHCFWFAGRRSYVDEDLNVLPERVEPCGDWALKSYRRLDDDVSRALGLPLAPTEAP